MKDRASLKRKLEQLRDEQHAIQTDLASLQQRLDNYEVHEFQAFVLARCKRITKFSKIDTRTCTFDNGLKAYLHYNFCTADVYESGENERLGMFSPTRCSISSFKDREFNVTMPRLAQLVDISPELQLLAHEVLRAWLESLKVLDVEALMTACTLRWITQQLPQDTMWADIITGNFPL